MPRDTTWFPTEDDQQAGDDFVTDLFATPTTKEEEPPAPESEKDSTEPEAEGDEPKAEGDAKPEAEETPEPEEAEGDSEPTEEATDNDTEDKPGSEPPPEVVAHNAEVDAWGDLWDMRERARLLYQAAVEGGPTDLLKAFESYVSPVRTDGFISAVLEARAAEWLATKHGMTTETLTQRLGPQSPVSIDAATEAAIAALPPEQQEVLRAVVEERARLEKLAADREALLRQSDEQYTKQQQQAMAQDFARGFLTRRDSILTDLVPDPALYASVWGAAYPQFEQAEATKKAIAALQDSVTRNDPPELTERYWNRLRDQMSIAVKAELELRKLAPKGTTPTKPASTPKPKPAAKAKAAAAKTATPAAPATPKGGRELPKIAALDEILAELQPAPKAQAKRSA